MSFRLTLRWIELILRLFFGRFFISIFLALLLRVPNKEVTGDCFIAESPVTRQRYGVLRDYRRSLLRLRLIVFVLLSRGLLFLSVIGFEVYRRTDSQICQEC